MVFNSAAMVAVAEVSTNTWQRMRRVPSSEMLNTQQLLEMACCFPLGHLVLSLWEFLCFPISDDTFSSSSSDDDADDEDMVAFDHSRLNSYGDDDDHHGTSSSSTLDFDDYYHYSHSD